MAMSFRTADYLWRRLRARLSGRGNVHFIHIRKTGGTALKNALLPFPVTPAWMIYLHPHRFRLEHVPARHRVMFVVRDPIARYVSGFGSRLRQGLPAHNVPWTADEKLAFERFPTAESLALALDPAHPRHAEALHAMGSITHINCGYFRDWFGDEAALERRRDSILFIGRTETLDAEFPLLRAALGLPEDVRLPADEKGANRTAGGPRNPLSAEAERLLRGWYADDFRFIAWCEAWRAEHAGPLNRGLLPSG